MPARAFRSLLAAAALLAGGGGACYQDDPIALASLPPVATVTVEPERATLAVGDTSGFVATARDSVGSVLAQETSWFGSDSSVFVIEALGFRYARIRARGAGTAVLSATSGGKVGQATITVP